MVFKKFIALTLYIDKVVKVTSLFGVEAMSREDWACVALMILGILLFLYGANFYDNIVGWTGVFLFAISFFALIALAIHNYLRHKPEAVSPEAKLEGDATLPPQSP